MKRSKQNKEKYIMYNLRRKKKNTRKYKVGDKPCAQENERFRNPDAKWLF